MTKKHFVALAEAIKAHNRRTIGQFTAMQLNTLADFCQSQNAQFDRALFLQACGIAPCCVTHAAHGGNCK